ELVKGRQSAREASRLQSEFLANMGHEIRTPLSGVIGLAGVLLDTKLDDRQREDAEGIQACGRDLLAVLDNILDFSKMEAGRLELEPTPFALRPLLEELARSFAAQAQDKQLELSWHIRDEVPPVLEGDPRRLRQALAILLGNALKFTEKGTVQ